MKKRRMRKITAISILFVSLALILSRQARADSSFSGMVIDITVYSVSVKDDSGNVKIFQIRPSTRSEKNIHPQDRVNVSYQIIDGIQVATHITITKRYGL